MGRKSVRKFNKSHRQKPVMVNLACGYIGHDDWINVDWGILSFINTFPLVKKVIFSTGLAPKNYNKKWPKNLRLVNLRKSFPFDDESLDFVFTAHFIEHLQKYEAVWLFRQVYRALKPGGVIRVVVPDLDIVTRQYIDDKDPFHRVEVLNNHFWGVLPKQETPPSLHDKALNFFARGHNWLYNYDYMKKVLMLGGFNPNKIIKQKYRKGKVPNLSSLDNHPDHSLYVEATK